MEQKYNTTGITISELNELLDTQWSALKNDPKLHQQAKALGIDISSIQTVERQNAITVARDKTFGLDPSTTAVIVAFAPVAAKVTRDLWEKILLPWILREKGDTALRPSKH